MRLNPCQDVLGRMLTFQSPFGILGRVAEKLFLTHYLTGFLVERNIIIKDFAETDKWKNILHDREYL